MALLCNDVSHWLGASLESALQTYWKNTLWLAGDNLWSNLLWNLSSVINEKHHFTVWQCRYIATLSSAVCSFVIKQFWMSWVGDYICNYTVYWQVFLWLHILGTLSLRKDKKIQTLLKHATPFSLVLHTFMLGIKKCTWKEGNPRFWVWKWSVQVWQSCS